MIELYTKPWHLLNLDIHNAINPEFEFNDIISTLPDRGHGVWRFEGDDLLKMFTKDWLDYMFENNLELCTALVFYRLPKTNSNYAHIDIIAGQENCSTIAINWVLTDTDDSDFVWYDLPDSEPTGVARSTLDYTDTYKYNSWHISKLSEITRRTIGNNPTVIRVDIPHALHIGNNARMCISIRCNPKITVSSWEEIVDYIRPKISLDTE
jgi:hypothetical protein